MKNLATFVFALLLTCSLSFAQNGGSSKGTKTGQGATTGQGPTGDAHEVYIHSEGNKSGKQATSNTGSTSTPK